MPPTPLRSISLIISPYHLGVRNIAVANGPQFLRERGLITSLRETGLPVREIEIEPVDSFDGDIARSFELLRRTSVLVTQERNAGSFPIVLSGNCTASVGVAAGLYASDGLRESTDLACVWFDAHDDYNTPETVMSGYFDSMPVAMMLGQCWKGMLGTVPGHRVFTAEQIAFVGLRDVTELERERVVDTGFDVVWGSTEKKVDYVGELGEILKKGRANPTMVHLDLDCLDDSLGKANKFAAPGGLLEDDIVGCLQQIPMETQPVSLTVASFDPSLDGGQTIGDIAVRGVRAFVDSLIAHYTPQVS